MVEMCNECSKMFMTVSQLRVHKRMRHGFSKAERKQKEKIKLNDLGIDWVKA